MPIPKPRFPKLTPRKKPTVKGGRPAKLWRYKKKGREYGSWRTTVNGKEVDFETDDSGEARRRWAASKANDFGWQRQTAKTAASIFGGPSSAPFTPPASPANAAPVTQSQMPPGQSSVDPAPTPPSPQQEPRPGVPPGQSASGPVNPEYIPPGAPWHQAAHQAAGQSQAQAQAGPRSAMDAQTLASAMGLQNVDELFHFVGAGVARAQLVAQAWVIRKRGVVAGEVPEKAPPFQLLAYAWGLQLRQWIPTANDVPVWVCCIAAGAMCGIYQISTGTAVPPEEQATESDAAKPTEHSAL